MNEQRSSVRNLVKNFESGFSSPRSPSSLPLPTPPTTRNFLHRSSNPKVSLERSARSESVGKDVTRGLNHQKRSDGNYMSCVEGGDDNEESSNDSKSETNETEIENRKKILLAGLKEHLALLTFHKADTASSPPTDHRNLDRDLNRCDGFHDVLHSSNVSCIGTAIPRDPSDTTVQEFQQKSPTVTSELSPTGKCHTYDDDNQQKRLKGACHLIIDASTKYIAVLNQRCHNFSLKLKGLISTLHNRAVLSKQHLSHFTKRFHNASTVVLMHMAQMSMMNVMDLSGLLLSMVSTLEPTAPRCNTAVTGITLLYQSSHIQMKRSKSFFYVFVIIVLVSAVVDIDWLISDYYSLALAYDIDDFSYRSNLDSKPFRTLAWYAILFCLFSKIVSLHGLMRSSTRGQTVQKRVWRKVSLFLPPLSKEDPQDIVSLLEYRVIAIFWIEFVCTIVVFTMAIYVHLRFGYSVYFTSPSPIISLESLLFAKACSGSLLILSILWKVNIYDAITKLCWNRSEQRAPRSHVVNPTFLKFNGCIKMVDLVIGLMIWVSLGWIRRFGDKIKEIRVVMVMLGITTVFTEITSLALCCTILWFHLKIERASRMNTIQERSLLPSSSRTFHSIPSTQGARSQNRLISSTHQHSSSGFVLDENVVCDPEHFMFLWREMEGVVFEYDNVSLFPSLRECHEHFQSRHFYVVASGVAKQVVKIYLAARSNNIQCFCEVIFSPQQKGYLRIELKCRDSTMVQSYMNILHPSLLFGI